MKPCYRRGIAILSVLIVCLCADGFAQQIDYEKAREDALGGDAAAMSMLRKAAKWGDVEAQYSLGVLHDDGEGELQDYDEAIVWYKKAAERGHENAEYKLVAIYAEGRGVSQEDAEMDQWFNKAILIVGIALCCLVACYAVMTLASRSRRSRAPGA